MKFSNIALLGAATVAAAQPQHAHNHAHRHHARGSPVEKRDTVVTTTAPGPVVTVYELNGVDVAYNDVVKGLEEGKYVLVSDTTITTSSTTSSSTTPTPTPSTSSEYRREGQQCGEAVALVNPDKKRKEEVDLKLDGNGPKRPSDLIGIPAEILN